MVRRSRAGRLVLLLAAAAVAVLLPAHLGPAAAAPPESSIADGLPPAVHDVVHLVEDEVKHHPYVAMGVLAVLALLALYFLLAVLLPMLLTLLRYWRVMLFFWRGGRYADLPAKFNLTAFSRAHLYSLASVPWLMRQKHYRTGTFQEDMLTNLRNVVLPTGYYGLPLSTFARSRLRAVFAIMVVIPVAAFVGSFWRRLRGMERSALACFQRSLLAPTDWFQLWRLNCRLASMVALATGSSDFELEDKYRFIRACEAKGLPVTPVLDKPVTLIAKDVLEEGGMGIHVLKNVVHGGRWILQERIDNCEAVNQLLPSNAPLSTVRVVTASFGALQLLKPDNANAGRKAVALATVWRAGREGAQTDHRSVMFDVPNSGRSEVLGSGSSSAHWYASGWKAWWTPLSTADGSIKAHPDTGRVLAGESLPGVTAVAALCERAHSELMPTVPLAGWDVALCSPKGNSIEPSLVLLEANLSCNFFRGSIKWEEYAELLDSHFASIDEWRHDPTE